MRNLAFAVLLFCVGSLKADMVPDGSRVIDWTGVGRAGGIPDTSSWPVYTVVNNSMSQGAIRAQIFSCPPGQVVQFAPGTYTWTTSLNLDNAPNGIAIRGSGADRSDPANATVWEFTGSSGGEGRFYVSLRKRPFDDFVNPPLFAPLIEANWIAGYSKDSTEITLSSTSGMAVGNLLYLDQLNDSGEPWSVTTISQEGCPYCGRNAGGGNSETTGRAQTQTTRITGINGNVVSIDPPIWMPNWKASLSPQAVYWGNSITDVGFQDFAITNATAPGNQTLYNFEIQGVDSCWFYNVNSYSAFNAHISIEQGSNNQVQHCRFQHTQGNASQSYGVVWQFTSSSLVVDCIFDDVIGSVMMAPAASGNAALYNFATNDLHRVSTGWQYQMLITHAAHINHALFEGNWVSGAGFDNIHGSASHHYLFRNRLIGKLGTKTDNTKPIDIHAGNRYVNVIGNILGLDGYHTHYERSGADTHSADNSIYTLGYWNKINVPGVNDRHPFDDSYDAVVASSIYRHGNYDFVNDAIVWDAGNPDQNIPDSLVYQSKPAFFGSLPWPPFNVADATDPALMDMTNIPAGFRYVHGVDPAAVQTAPVFPSTMTTNTPGNVGSSFSYQIPHNASFGAPTSYGAYTLPDGLSVAEGNGQISGTPTTEANTVITLGITNSFGFATTNFHIEIAAGLVPVVTSSLTASGSQDVAFSYFITADNGPITAYTIVESLPAGLSLNATTGELSGTPTGTGVHNLTLGADNSFGSSAGVTLVLTISAPAAVIAVTPLSHDFEYAAIGGSPVDKVFKVSNAGASTLAGAASVNAPLSVVGTSSYSLTAGQEQDVTIRYTAEEPIQTAENITFTGGDGITVGFTARGYRFTNILFSIPMTNQFFYNDSLRGFLWTVGGNYIAQSDTVTLTSQNFVTDSGVATVGFNLTNASVISLKMTVATTDGGNNSIYIAVDELPTVEAETVWHMPITGGAFAEHDVVIGTTEITNRWWHLSSGIHAVYIRGREADARLRNLKVELVSEESIPNDPTSTNTKVNTGISHMRGILQVR